MEAEWVPLRSFSVFEFGSHIDTYGNLADVRRPGLDLPESLQSKGGGAGRYFVEDLECDLLTHNGIIHEVRARFACLYNGFNLVGSKVAAALHILGQPQVVWSIPDPEDPVSRIMEVPSMGLSMNIPNATGAVYSLALFGQSVMEAAGPSAGFTIGYGPAMPRKD
jgi:hypothetical protein